MSQTEVAALPFDRTIVILPVSPLERHGPHLPVGTDVILARRLAEGLGAGIEQRWPDVKVVLFPTIPLGAQVVWGPGSASIGQRALREMLIGCARSLARSGFRYLLFCNAHGGIGHCVALEEAAEHATRRLAMRAESVLSHVLIPFLNGRYANEIEQRMGRAMTDEERKALTADCHGGQWETGAMLWLRPDLVDPGFNRLPPVPRTGWLKLAECMAESCRRDLGYVGIPSLATADYARAAAEVLQARVLEKVDLMLHSPRFRPSHTPFYYWPSFRTRPGYRGRHVQAAALVGLAAGVGIGLAAGAAMSMGVPSALRAPAPPGEGAVPQPPRSNG
ncbi:MAG: creatininase family protein [Chloroflexi bacterium]|nr:creatininase family protein [Chloroflexota bacterium]